MMQITIDATKEELDQLAIMAYIARYVVDSSGKSSTAYRYPLMKVFDDMLRKVNKELLTIMPESKYVEADEKYETIFTNTMKTEETCEVLLDQFSNDMYLERICTEITVRDYIEQGGSPETAASFASVVFASIYENNMKELKEYGLSRFKIIE